MIRQSVLTVLLLSSSVFAVENQPDGQPVGQLLQVQSSEKKLTSQQRANLAALIGKKYKQGDLDLVTKIVVNKNASDVQSTVRESLQLLTSIVTCVAVCALFYMTWKAWGVLNKPVAKAFNVVEKASNVAVGVSAVVVDAAESEIKEYKNFFNPLQVTIPTAEQVAAHQLVCQDPAVTAGLMDKLGSKAVANALMVPDYTKRMFGCWVEPVVVDETSGE